MHQSLVTTQQRTQTTQRPVNSLSNSIQRYTNLQMIDGQLACRKQQMSSAADVQCTLNGEGLSFKQTYQENRCALSRHARSTTAQASS